MKDYYSILGVEETATVDEIRQRWVELMREFHPDRAGDLTEEQIERVKEINEAYQVLKHSATRVEYDLKRRYSSRSWIKRHLNAMVVVLGIALAACFGTFCLKSKSNPVSGIAMRYEKAQGPRENGGTRINLNLHQNDIVGRPSISDNASIPVAGRAMSLASKPVPKVQNKFSEQKTERSNKSLKDSEHLAASPPPVEGIFYESSKRKLLPSSDGIVLDQQSLQQKGHSTDAPLPDESKPVKKVLLHPAVPDRFEKTESEIRPSASAGTPPTEKEIFEFLEAYTRHYVEKNASALLQMFSAQAVQNGKYDFDAIRRIYEKFFDESLEFQYRLDSVNIEIFQNAVEVSARYSVSQTLKNGGLKKLLHGPIRWILVREDGELRILYLDYAHIQ